MLVETELTKIATVLLLTTKGHCQRHGAKAKRCKIDGCEKQAQGTHDGMCKRHWKAMHFPEVSSTQKASLDDVSYETHR